MLTRTLKTTAAGATLLFAVVGTATGSAAQPCEPAWSREFQSFHLNGLVRCAVVHHDASGASVYVGGAFTTAGSVPAKAIARWTGTGWVEVGNGLTASATAGIWALTSFNDGGGPGLFAGGDFQMSAGSSPTSVAKWNGTSWTGLPGPNGSVRSLISHNDGSGAALYAGGEFYLFPSGVEGIARWTGNAWAGVGRGLGSPNPRVWSLAAFESSLVAGGAFTHSAGVPMANVARWDGAQWAPLGSGLPSGEVYALTTGPEPAGPALFAGGSFSVAGGAPADFVARWNGSTWHPLAGGPPVPMSGSVRALHLFDPGTGPRLHAGFADGSWWTGGVAEWDGARWLVHEGAPTQPVFALTSDVTTSPHRLLAAASSRTSSYWTGLIATWHGSAWVNLGGSTGAVGAYVKRLRVADTGSGPRIHAVGAFTNVGTAPARGVSRLDDSGWVGFGSGVESPNDIAVFDDGTGGALYACGVHLLPGAPAAVRVARFTAGAWDQVGNLNNPATALEVYDDGNGPRLYTAGSFTLSGSLADGGGIARWNGASWEEVGGGVKSANGTPHVNALAVFDDGSERWLIAGGLFHLAGGMPALHIASWNGGTWAALGTGLDAQVYDLAAVTLGRPLLVVVGQFTVAGGLTANRIAAWDGSEWTTFGPGLHGGKVLSAAVADDGSGLSLYAAGTFNIAAGSVANRLARWNGVSWLPVGSGVADHVYALLANRRSSVESLWLGGPFTEVGGGVNSYRLARWVGCSTCYADCDQSGSLMAADFACFQSKFAAGEPYADCAQDGALTIADFACFQAKFVAGCP